MRVHLCTNTFAQAKRLAELLSRFVASWTCKRSLGGWGEGRGVLIVKYKVLRMRINDLSVVPCVVIAHSVWQRKFWGGCLATHRRTDDNLVV